MPGSVYVHVGLNKTGTSYLQQALWSSRDALAGAGVLVPGENHRFQRRAFWDLLGRRLRGVDQPRVPGSWQTLVQTVRDWPGAQVVLSDEFLVNAGPGHARRIARAFAPARLHVVVTVRDLERVLCSMWQTEVAKRRTLLPWAEFVAAVRDPEHGPATAGVAFWHRYDLRRVLRVWETVVPPQRIHVVLVPPPGSPPTALLDRFATAIGVPRAAMTAPPNEVNTDLGLVETEVLRRLGRSLSGRLDEQQYRRHVLYTVRPALRGLARSSPIRLPDEERAWVMARSRRLVDFLESGPYDLVGDPKDLLPRQPSEQDPAPAAGAGEVVDAALAALAATVERYATDLSPRGRRPHLATATTRLGSARRALGFKARVFGLEAADHHALLARLARQYLRHTCPGSRAH